MDNQQPRLEQSKVQRSSRKRVLDISKNIIWETPYIINKIFIYKLVSSEDNTVRYIGITSDPHRRLSHHGGKDSIKEKNHKACWIKSIINKGFDLKMIVFDIANNLEEALEKEESYISSFENLTNSILQSTHPGSKKCYLYNIYTKECHYFISLQTAARFLNINGTSLYERLILSKWLFSYTNNFEEEIKLKHTIKALNRDTQKIEYFITQEHAAYYIGCTHSMINLCLMKHRKSANNWLLCKKNESFISYYNKHESPIKCLNDDKIFSTIKKAAIHYSVDESSIAKVCKGLRKRVKKLKFEYYNDMIHPS